MVPAVCREINMRRVFLVGHVFLCLFGEMALRLAKPRKFVKESLYEVMCPALCLQYVSRGQYQGCYRGDSCTNRSRLSEYRFVC